MILLGLPLLQTVIAAPAATWSSKRPEAATIPAGGYQSASCPMWHPVCALPPGAAKVAERSEAKTLTSPVAGASYILPREASQETMTATIDRVGLEIEGLGLTIDEDEDEEDEDEEEDLYPRDKTKFKITTYHVPLVTHTRTKYVTSMPTKWGRDTASNAPEIVPDGNTKTVTSYVSSFIYQTYTSTAYMRQTRTQVVQITPTASTTAGPSGIHKISPNAGWLPQITSAPAPIPMPSGANVLFAKGVDAQEENEAKEHKPIPMPSGVNVLFAKGVDAQEKNEVEKHKPIPMLSGANVLFAKGVDAQEKNEDEEYEPVIDLAPAL